MGLYGMYTGHMGYSHMLWGKPQLSHTNNEGKQKLKNQNQNTEQRTAKGSFV
jgi:hypothetical protein